jgi:Ca2+-binding EF-hand superfamily protein
MVRTQASNSWLLTMVIQIGILLKPSEMKLMLDALDFDGSGDISLQEFESFWRQAPPLRWNDGKIMAAP